jgi:GDPmannose 4,6-dehydratase
MLCTRSSAGRPRSTPAALITFIKTNMKREYSFLHYGDVTDATNLIRIIQETKPDELYNLAAQSHVQVSFETPEYTANSHAVGALRLLEAIRILGCEKKTRVAVRTISHVVSRAPRAA